eukprot:g745.t1
MIKEGSEAMRRSIMRSSTLSSLNRRNRLFATRQQRRSPPPLLLNVRRTKSGSAINRSRAFIELERDQEKYRDPSERAKDWLEINRSTLERDPLERKKQAARCMDCGTPFCQTHSGCPIHNLIPEWNELVYQDQWKTAIDRLHETNNFPEFTGRVCPAPCEGSCVLGHIEKPVTIKNIEYAIVDRAWNEGWIKAEPPERRSDRSVAIVGSGPAGLAAADQLNRAGHNVTVYERAPEIGGLLTYGIPNMKLDKRTVARRVQKMRDEGVSFITNAHIGQADDFPVEDILMNFDAVVLAVGSTVPRELAVEGGNLDGVHVAMDFLTANQEALFAVGLDGDVHAWEDAPEKLISARGKRVMVIGGGDTGTDCIGTAVRHGCESIVNLEILPQPPDERDETNNPWPEWPRVFRVDYGHGEAAAMFGEDPRTFQVMTEKIEGDESGRVRSVRTSEVRTVQRSEEDGGGFEFEKVPGTERDWDVDLVILALGFESPERTIVDRLGLATDARGNVLAHYQANGGFRAMEKRHGTEFPGVFVAGDCRRGQSLVVWAINEGRMAADEVCSFLSESQTNERAMG